MQFKKTTIEGVLVVELDTKPDERGYFVRTWDSDEFKRQGLFTHIAESNVSYNKKRGTLRGMHHQKDPFAQAKLVRCTRGKIFDVALDLRKGSPTVGKWFGIELLPDDTHLLYIPKGLAHGFQTLEDDSVISYDMDAPFQESASDGVRYDDPAFNIPWPLPVSVIKERDREYPDWQP